MSDNTHIEWTDATWPVTTGCDDASMGCLHCYSKRDSHRLAHNPNPKVAAAYAGTTERRGDGPIRWTGLVRTLPDRLDWPLKWKKPRRVFVGNMSDLFHESVPEEFIEKVFAVMAMARHHTFQVLTKRADRMSRWLTPGYDNCEHAVNNAILRLSDGRCWLRPDGWPLPNVWVGVSCEDQARAEERIPELLKIPARVRFLSCEPLLAPIDLRGFLGGPSPFGGLCSWESTGKGPFVDWVIAGGESGPGARPMHPAWARSIRDQCIAAGVPYFFKQNGEYIHESQIPCDFYRDRESRGVVEYRWSDDTRSFKVGKKAAGRLLDGRIWDEFPEVPAVAPTAGGGR